MTAHDETPTPVGVREIAARAGVSEITVRKWVERHDASPAPFPRPVGPVSGHHAWWWHEVVEWLATTGRLTRVTRLERDDPQTLATQHVTIRHDPINRSWLLRGGNDDTAIRSHVTVDHSRPWLHSSEDDLVAEVRSLLLAGWAITDR